MNNKLFLTLLLILGLASCQKPEARRPISRSSGSYIELSAERNKELYGQEKQYLQELASRDTVLEFLSSPNGFWYANISSDTIGSDTPKVGDLVRFSYDIRSLEGDTLVTRAENGLISYRIDQSNQELISGIREGLKVMKAGDVTEFLFPSYQAYGYYGLQGKIEPNQMVRSTIELYTVNEDSLNN